MAGAKNVSRAARLGMKKFTENGGGSRLHRAAWRRMSSAGRPRRISRREPAAPENAAALTAQIHRSGVAPLPAAVKVAHEDGNSGIFFRMVRTEKERGWSIWSTTISNRAGFSWKAPGNGSI